jgi:hypothetical protein
MSLKILLASALSCAALLVGSARADTITSLFNTGVGDSGAVLSNGAADTHYTLVSTPDSSTPSVRAATSANGFPVGPWIGDDTVSTWVAPNTDAELDGPAGGYDYRISFSLTGLNPGSALITGLWAVDDVGLDILVNGTSTGETTSFGFSGFTAFDITSGFVDGANTLDFIVYNGGGPTGLRVEMTGTADVPEPATLALLGAGVAGLGMIRRRSV